MTPAMEGPKPPRTNASMMGPPITSWSLKARGIQNIQVRRKVIPKNYKAPELFLGLLDGFIAYLSSYKS